MALDGTDLQPESVSNFLFLEQDDADTLRRRDPWDHPAPEPRMNSKPRGSSSATKLANDTGRRVARRADGIPGAAVSIAQHPVTDLVAVGRRTGAPGNSIPLRN